MYNFFNSLKVFEFPFQAAIEQIGSIKSGDKLRGDFKNFLYFSIAISVTESSFIFPSTDIVKERNSASVCLSLFLGSQPRLDKIFLK